MRRLQDPPYLAFPFRVGSDGPAVADRREHVRGQIEQVLFTNPPERLFRPEFGAGLAALLFENNAPALWELARKRLLASLGEALHGEVDPQSLRVEVTGVEERVLVTVSYQLAAIGHQESHRFELGAGGNGGG